MLLFVDELGVNPLFLALDGGTQLVLRDVSWRGDDKLPVTIYHEFHWSHHPKPDWPTSDYLHWLQQKGVKFNTPSYNGSKYVEVRMPAEHHQTTWCAEMAIQFMEAQADFDNPWLFSVNIFAPHHPFDPPVDYLARYLDKLDDIPLPNFTPGELDNKPKYQQLDHNGAYNNPNLYPYSQMTDDDHRLIIAAYWAMCDHIDEQVGRMVQALEDTGQLDNTIVIFMSDHGEMLGDHGIYLKGPHFYEPAVHVPLIVSYPKAVQTGKRSTALVELFDIAPTILETVGLPQPTGMQAQSLWSLLTSASDLDTHRDSIYCEYYEAWIHDHASATMICDDRYKLNAFHGLRTGELYDLESDPDEITNQWSNPDYVDIKMTYLERLCARMAETVDPIPPREARW